MRTLGIHIATGQCRFSVLDGTCETPTLVEKGRLATPGHEDVPVLMDWYDSQFRQLVTSYNPDRLAYRLTLDPKKDQLFCSEFPLGVLNLIAHQKSLPIAAYTSRSFTPTRLGLKKSANIYTYCDDVFGRRPPHWDDAQKHSLLVAWFELPQ